MNWEGHDEWFHDNSLFEAFTQGVPPPLVKPLLSCETVKQRHLKNTYEQTALPERNCRVDKTN